MDSLIGMRFGKTVAVSEWYWSTSGKSKVKVIDVKCDCGSDIRPVRLSPFLKGAITRTTHSMLYMAGRELPTHLLGNRLKVSTKTWLQLTKKMRR